MPELPLSGRVVVDLTRNLAGPFATMILAELGADVIKIEHPERGDDTRQWGPPFWRGESAMFLALNRNKRSIGLDLHAADAKERLASLLGGADVLVESFRPGYLEGLGMDADWARSVRPDLVYASVSGFGARGPLAGRAAYDPLIQAYAGLMSVTGEPGRGPVRVGVGLNDLGTGMWAALGILAALLARAQGGAVPIGRVDASLFETALSFMSYHLTGFWAGGGQPARMGSAAGMIAPYEAFRTRDEDVMICVGNDKLFDALCRTLGLPALAEAPAYADNPARVRNRQALHDALEAVTASLGAAELTRALEAAGVPASEIRGVGQVAEDAQAAALGMFQDTEHPTVGRMRSVALPLTFDGERPPLRRPPPLLRQHEGEIEPQPTGA